ncbi:MAG: photosynthetic complex putative assembly protein PuhB [Pseudomonadota bacterium]
MNLFHDEEEGPIEPVRGLPGHLPKGEKLIWQGQPSATGLLFGAFRIRWVIGYFVLVTFGRLAHLASIEAEPAAMTAVCVSSAVTCALAISVLTLIALAMSRAAIFTITSERVIIRHGVAFTKYINAPFASMKSAQLKRRSARLGDIALQMSEAGSAPYLHLWPFAKPFHFGRPQPMLRSIHDPESVARILAEAAQAHSPDHVNIAADRPSIEANIESDIPAGLASAH